MVQGDRVLVPCTRILVPPRGLCLGPPVRVLDPLDPANHSQSKKHILIQNAILRTNPLEELPRSPAGYRGALNIQATWQYPLPIPCVPEVPGPCAHIIAPNCYR